jgi:hypothetical protein
MGHSRHRKAGGKRQATAWRARAVSKGPRRLSGPALAKRADAAFSEADSLRTASHELVTAVRELLRLCAQYRLIFRLENQAAQERLAHAVDRSQRRKNSK